MATSKEEILKTSRVLIQQNGWEAVNIRAVAAACGVSVGCIYNYFGSKTELVSAAVESIWSDIFRHPDDPAVFEDTLSCIRWMYRQMEYGSEQYPGFFTHHALGFVRQDTADGKQQMRQTWQHILDALTMVLTRDKKIRPDAFTEEFTRQKFAGILFSSCFLPWCSRILTPQRYWRSSAGPFMKCKKHPTVLWEFFTAKSERCSY